MLLCPTCSCVVESFGVMNKLHDRYHCHLCRTDIEAKLDDYIAVTFTVSQQIRSIKFHQPADLTPSEHCFCYVLSREGRLPDGDAFADMWGRITRAVNYLLPEATTRFEVDAEPGLLIGWDTQRDIGFGFAVDVSAPSSGLMHVRLSDSACDPGAGAVAPGKVTIEVENATPRRVLFGITNLPKCRSNAKPRSRLVRGGIWPRIGHACFLFSDACREKTVADRRPPYCRQSLRRHSALDSHERGHVMGNKRLRQKAELGSPRCRGGAGVSRCLWGKTPSFVGDALARKNREVVHDRR